MNRPVIVFRTEGGLTIGLGHIRRSMTLAKELSKQGAKVHFVVNQEPLALDILRRHGFDAMGVGETDEKDFRETLAMIDRCKARGIVIDSYRIRDLSPLRGHIPFTWVIDDLADRSLPIDLIVNGAVGAPDLAYHESSQTRLLLGAAYALLREEFSHLPPRRIRESVERVLITAGGTDSNALTPDLIRWSREALPNVSLDVVIGPFFSENTRRGIVQIAQLDQLVALHVDPIAPHKLMLDSDMAVTGGGQTTYELAATGTPALGIKLAENQVGNLSGLSAAGALVWVGGVGDADLRQQVMHNLKNLARSIQTRDEMSRAGRALVDGQGARRVAQVVLEACSR